MRTRALALLALLVVVSGCGSSSPGVRLGSVDEVAGRVTDNPDGLVILDVRTAEEFVETRIDGAVPIDFNLPDFGTRVASLNRSVPYVLYCRTGNRSEAAATIMKDLGFEDVIELDGGIVAWAAAGKPMVSG